MPTSKVSVIIPHWNGIDILADCLESLKKNTYPNIEIIVVDNNSKDNSHIECKDNFSQIKLIENKENLGYCAGNNVGINSANGKYIVILNPDTTVTSSWLDAVSYTHLTLSTNREV